MHNSHSVKKFLLFPLPLFIRTLYIPYISSILLIPIKKGRELIDSGKSRFSLTANEKLYVTFVNACAHARRIFGFQAFEDGAGFSTGVGSFTFQQTGCRSLEFQSAFGNAMVSNIQGSQESGVLTFNQSSAVPDLDNISAGCLLVVF